MNAKKKAWALMLAVAMIFTSMMPGFAMLASADGDEPPETVASDVTAKERSARDISSQLITELKIIVDPDDTKDVSGQTFETGTNLYVHCEFNEGTSKQIAAGDTISVTWPGNPEKYSCYLGRSTITEDFIDGDNEKLGVIHYTHQGAQIVFNQRASEKLDVKGSFTFKVRAVNSKDNTTGKITVKAGEKEKSFFIHRGVGGTRGKF